MNPNRPFEVTRRSVIKTSLTTGAAISLSGCAGEDTDSEGESGENSTSAGTNRGENPTSGGRNSGETTTSEETDSEETSTSEETNPYSNRVEVEAVAEGLSNPWAIEFIPNTSQMLVTEEVGLLNLLNRENGTLKTVAGTPEVYGEGHGGLLDVTLHPDEPWVYLTYSATNDANTHSALHLGRGRLDRTKAQLKNFEVLHVAEPFLELKAGDGQYGSRVVFGEDGMLYMSTGDREFKDAGSNHVSQELTNELGATLRLAPDGSIPDDNPFVDKPEVQDAIFSYGHRDVQAMTVHPQTGDLWQSDHGESGGDEINIIKKGGNYGWPTTSYACGYNTGEPVGGQDHERENIVNPVHYWECGSGGFPPSGMTFYDGDAFSDWQGDLFIGTLRGEYLGRFTVDGKNVEEVDPLLANRGWRIRDVTVAPDTGYLYATADSADAPVVRLMPSEG